MNTELKTRLFLLGRFCGKTTLNTLWVQLYAKYCAEFEYLQDRKDWPRMNKRKTAILNFLLNKGN